MAIQERVSRVLDVKGFLCPSPVIKTSEEIKQVGLGDVLEVLTTDPGSRPDITAWARMTGNELLGVEEVPGTPKSYRFYIRRTR